MQKALLKKSLLLFRNSLTDNLYKGLKTSFQITHLCLSAKKDMPNFHSGNRKQMPSIKERNGHNNEQETT